MYLCVCERVCAKQSQVYICLFTVIFSVAIWSTLWFFRWMRPFTSTHHTLLRTHTCIHLYAYTVCHIVWSVHIFFCLPVRLLHNIQSALSIDYVLLFYRRILMNAFNMFFVRYVWYYLFAVCFLSLSRSVCIHSRNLPSSIPYVRECCSLVISFSGSVNQSTYWRFLTIKSKQMTQKSIIEHLKLPEYNAQHRTVTHSWETRIQKRRSIVTVILTFEIPQLI